MGSFVYVDYKIGICCMESFSYESLLKICKKLKVDIRIYNS